VIYLGAIPVFFIAMFYPGLAGPGTGSVIMQRLYILIQFVGESTVCLSLFKEDEWLN